MILYVLKLEDEKYYVGITHNFKRRYKQHMNGKASSWTRRFKPLEVFEKMNIDDVFDETKYTIRYMAKYGIENVRGGSFCKMYLTNYDKKFIRKQINAIEHRCYYCNKKGHFINECILYNREYICYVCNIHGHYIQDCPLLNEKKESYTTLKPDDLVNELDENNKIKDYDKEKNKCECLIL
jgi:hypothetical protein